jgi:hypothetical protein
MKLKCTHNDLNQFTYEILKKRRFFNGGVSRILYITAFQANLCTKKCTYTVHQNRRRGICLTNLLNRILKKTSCLVTQTAVLCTYLK